MQQGALWMLSTGPRNVKLDLLLCWATYVGGGTHSHSARDMHDRQHALATPEATGVVDVAAVQLGPREISRGYVAAASACPAQGDMSQVVPLLLLLLLAHAGSRPLGCMRQGNHVQPTYGWLLAQHSIGIRRRAASGIEQCRLLTRCVAR